MTEEFCDIYSYLMQRIYCNPSFELKQTSRNLIMISKFLKKMNMVSEESIWEYLTFQIVLNDRKEARKHSLTLNNCISLKAIKRWKERSSEEMFILSKIQRQRGLINPYSKKASQLSEEYLDLLRKKFWNTPRGFILCREYEGLLFNKERCNECRYKEVCEIEI